MRDTPHSRFLFEVWVGYHRIFPLLIGHQNLFPALCLQQHTSTLLENKVALLYLPPVDKRERQAVRKEGPQLLHQVKCETRTTRAIAMQKANLRIKPHTL